MTKHSRQAAKRRAAELAAAAQLPTSLPADKEQHLTDYNPDKIAAHTWAAIRVTHNEIMRRSTIKGLDSFKKRCSELAVYLAGRHEAGQSIAIADSMTYTAIEEHISRRLGHLVDKSRADTRSRLRALAVAANPGLDAPKYAAATGYNKVRPPYELQDELAIKRIALRQRHPGARRNLCAAVGLCGGAGLNSQDLRELRVRDIADRGDQGISIEVGGKKPRRTVVRRDYEELVRVAIADRRPSDLVLGKSINRRNIVGNIVAAAEIQDDAPHIDSSRLRSTWLAWLVRRPVPLKVILDAAGLSSVRTLNDILDQLPADTATDDSVLRHDGDDQ